MRDQTQLLQLAVIARILEGGLQILIHTVDGHAMLGELGRDGGEHARIVVNHETYGELGLGRFDRRLLQVVIQRNDRACAALRDMTRLGDHVADHRGGGRSAARATTVEHEVIGRLGLDEHGVEGTVNGCQRMVVGDQRRIHSRGNAGFGILHDGQQFDDLVFGGGRGDVIGGDLGDAFDGHVVDGHIGVEAQGGHDGGLVGGVIAFDVAGRVGFGIALGLSVLEHVVEVEALGGHLVENVVGGAVDDAEHARHLVAHQRFAQRLEERNGTAYGGLEVDIDALGFGGRVNLRTVLGEQSLVGGDHGSTGFDGGEHELAGYAGTADQLDDDVRTGGHAHGVGGDHGLVDPWERVGFGGVEASDAGQFDRSVDARCEFIPLLHQQTCGLGADGTCTQQSNANRCNIFLCQGILPRM